MSAQSLPQGASAPLNGGLLFVELQVVVDGHSNKQSVYPIRRPRINGRTVCVRAHPLNRKKPAVLPVFRHPSRLLYAPHPSKRVEARPVNEHHAGAFLPAGCHSRAGEGPQAFSAKRTTTSVPAPPLMPMVPPSWSSGACVPGSSRAMGWSAGPVHPEFRRRYRVARASIVFRSFAGVPTLNTPDIARRAYITLSPKGPLKVLTKNRYRANTPTSCFRRIILEGKGNKMLTLVSRMFTLRD